ncbi:flavodoxin family protein [Saccharothrix violaceirubra]|uniref:NAD(P)H dehydrogenase (Quinone) n=1 Tax=Saccharothrix violaceirubra TaxID=413306 RepID=A0A7W7WXB1_9PSEU|nr:flavodoxin family protein [Saccharothrix violaceirubra]MBB4966917.1 NAD(P)H dehydrogenase (quinone) [Saccharothrix violaceirubra]
MTRALVVHESLFGNTRAVAEAVGAVLDARVVAVSDAPDVLPDDVDLLVVGAPTHAFGLSRPATRESADAPTTPVRGIREWLAALSPPGHLVTAHAFDTRMATRWPTGSAAKAVTRKLRALRFTVPRRPASFRVTGTTGPLLDGELDRATAWARTILAETSTRPR